MQTFDNTPPVFEVFVCFNNISKNEFDAELELIQFEYNTVILTSSKNPNIIAKFKEFLTYEEAKKIMFWFYDNYGMDVDGWGANYEMDPRLFQIEEDWHKEQQK